MNKKYIVVGIVVAILVVVVFVFYRISLREKTFSKIIYQIDYKQDTILRREDLNKYLKDNKIDIIGQVIDSVDKQKIEHTLKLYPYIEQVEVLNSKDKLIVKIKQEEILAKVYNRADKIFYLAKTGRILPYDSLIHGRFLIVNGNIDNQYRKNMYLCEDSLFTRKDSNFIQKYLNLYYIWKIAQYIDNDDFLKSQICQIYLDEDNNFQMSTLVGNHVVLFGKLTKSTQIEQVIDARFNNLKSIYINGFKIMGWDKYKIINLKYGKEIPCKKR